MGESYEFLPYPFMQIGLYYLFSKYWDKPISEGWIYYTVPFAIGLLIAITIDIVTFRKRKRLNSNSTNN